MHSGTPGRGGIGRIDLGFVEQLIATSPISPSRVATVKCWGDVDLCIKELGFFVVVGAVVGGGVTAAVDDHVDKGLAIVISEKTCLGLNASIDDVPCGGDGVRCEV